VAPVFFGQWVVVASGVDWIGGRSLSMSHLLTASTSQDDVHEVARATSVLVAYDYEAARSIDVPAGWREALAHHEGRELTRVPVEA
jgi:acyl-CoA thioesterase FadM